MTQAMITVYKNRRARMIKIIGLFLLTMLMFGIGYVIGRYGNGR